MIFKMPLRLDRNDKSISSLRAVACAERRDLKMWMLMLSSLAAIAPRCWGFANFSVPALNEEMS